jgi:hypothetical protein
MAEEIKVPKTSQKAKKRKKGLLVFNYSSVTLTKDMENLLNRGLNYSVLPEKT